MRVSKSVFWLLLIVATYSLGHAIWYWQPPLGQVPALDGQENLIIAEQIRAGALPDEPFYRAMLYPAVLAILPIHWMVLGLLCHFANTLLAMTLSRRLWNHEASALISGALVGCNPVLLHFALDPLDTTFAITLFLSGLAFFATTKDWTKASIRIGLGGCAIALAALARPHFLAILLPVILAATVLGFASSRFRSAGWTFAITAIAPLAILGGIQLTRGDSFRIMPTQGAYNLWVSNNANANGLYYSQTLSFHYVGEHKNPAKMESEALYLEERGEAGTVDERSAYWRNATIDHVQSDPIAAIRLMAFKGYAWLNNYEQYNNKTYSFHKSLSPWLRYNPIEWGVLLALAMLALTASRSQNANTVLWIGFGIAILYTFGSIIYMASARFRLPLAPLLAIVAGGAPLIWVQWKSIAMNRKIRSFAATAFCIAIAYSQFGSVASTNTIQQDTMLLADTSARLGRDLDAYNWANRTLELNPHRQDARRLRLLSFYNLEAMGESESTKMSWHDFAEDLETISIQDPFCDYVKGVAHWNYGNRARATQIWNDNFNRYHWDASSSLAALIYTNSPITSSLPPYNQSISHPDPLLVSALNISDPRGIKSQIRFPYVGSESFNAAIQQSFKRILPQQVNGEESIQSNALTLSKN